nr:MAG TPA: hypothetical protein [Bacteriophage sp.]
MNHISISFIYFQPFLFRNLISSICYLSIQYNHFLSNKKK